MTKVKDSDTVLKKNVRRANDDDVLREGTHNHEESPMAGFSEAMKSDKPNKEKNEKAPRYAVVVELSSPSGIPQKGAPGVGEKTFRDFCEKMGVSPEGTGLPIKGKVLESFDPALPVGSEISVDLAPGTNTMSVIKNLSAGYVNAGSQVVLEALSHEGEKLSARWSTNVSPTHRGMIGGVADGEAIFWKNEKGESVGLNLGAYASAGKDPKKMEILEEKMKSLRVAASAEVPDIRVQRTVYFPKESLVVGKGALDMATLAAEIEKMPDAKRGFALRLSSSGEAVTLSGERRNVATTENGVKKYVPESGEAALKRLIEKNQNEGVRRKIEKIEKAGGTVELIPATTLFMAANKRVKTDSATAKHVEDLVTRFFNADDKNHQKFLAQTYMNTGLRPSLVVTLAPSEANPSNPPYLSVIPGNQERYASLNALPTAAFDGKIAVRPAASDPASKVEGSAPEAPAIEEESLDAPDDEAMLSM